jgi:outer membrane protein OmpA-like peptidoglycan-associated protein
MQRLLLSLWLILFLSLDIYSLQVDKYFLLEDVTEENIDDFYAFIEAKAPHEDAFVALQRIAGPYIKAKDWKSAIDIFEEYKSKFPQKVEAINEIISILNAETEGLTEKNLGAVINTSASEYTPILRADMSQIYFSSFNRGTNEKHEDIYMADYSESEGWHSVRKLKGKINTPRNEAAQSLTVDSRRMYVYGNFEDALGRGDLYEFTWDDSIWTNRRHLPSPINTQLYEGDANISTNGDVLFFVSERPGGVGLTQWVQGEPFHGSTFGNTDIYISIKSDTGWSKPINLGKTINTPYAERKPQLHADGKTLYFCSDGHPGLGRLDIFMSKRLREDSWTEWSKPVNLGKELNGPGRDWGMYVTPKGDEAYFSASDKSVNYGLSDIYSIRLPMFARPEPVVAVQGKVIDQEGNPLQAEIIWEDLAQNREISKIQSSSKDGSFFFILPTGKIYGYHAEKDGYYPISKNLDLSKTNKYIKISETLTMVNIDDLLQGSVRINNIFFEYDKAILKPESFPELNRLVKMLKGIPGIKVEINGHTDNIGSADYNIELSEKRALSVINYLKENGLQDIEFIAKGYGKTVPVATNDTDEGRAQNRRVEFRIIKQE